MKQWACAQYVSLVVAVCSLAGCGASAAPATGAAAASPSPAVAQSVPPKPSAASPSPSGAAAPLSAAADWQAQWDRVLASAKQEGQVSVATTSATPAAIFDGFKAKYGITVTVVGQSAGTLLPKVKTERSAGQYLYDVSLNATNTTITGFKPIGALDPLPAALILPEVLDDKNWIGGFSEGWADSGRNLDYSTQRLAEPIVHVNRQAIPESQLSHIEQLWDPAWKGKIVMGDTRVPTTATPMLAAWLLSFGEDKVRTFLQTQQPVITNQPRQMAEWLVRGQYPIAFGVGVPDLTNFASQGLDLSYVKPLAPDEPGGVVADDGTGSVALFNRAPHPNAAKVLINWLLSQEGQSAAAKQTGYNSRRTDVPPVSPTTVVDPNKKYLRVQTEDSYPTFLRALAISKELIK
jgi:ABC-type Fe3+ transport system substrate-binding protein